jgi:hypothetical protein
MWEYVFSRVTPPTPTGIYTFHGIKSSCIIYVPDASTLAYRAATNWVTYAAYIYPVSNRTGNAVILFESNGGSVVAPLVGVKGEVAVKPSDPVKEGGTFGGWYKEVGLTNAWNWLSDVFPSTNRTLYAKWA